MTPQLLLCVDDRGLDPLAHVRKGHIYTLHASGTCSCGGHFTAVEESKWPWFMRDYLPKCSCMFWPYRSYQSRRFIPINDPSVGIEDTTDTKEPAHA